jgi:hypothetical protein
MNKSKYDEPVAMAIGFIVLGYSLYVIGWLLINF